MVRARQRTTTAAIVALSALAVACAASPKGAATRERAMTAEPIETRRSATVLRGSFTVPAGRTRFPAVVLAHGSGRLDRDGNPPGERGPSEYRLLAEALAERGIAVVRWDKRGAGASAPVTAEERTVDHLARDVAAFREELRADPRVCATTLLGHSEGAYIVMLALAKTDADAIITLAGPGRPLRMVLHEQVRAQVESRAVRSVREGARPRRRG